MDSLAFEELVPVATEPARAALVDADVVIGVDRNSRCEFTLYGMPSLESTVIINQPTAMRVLKVLLSSDRGELDRLLVAIRSIKGLDSHRAVRV